MAERRKRKRQDPTVPELDAERLTTLFDISQTLHHYRDLDGLITQIIARVSEVMRAETTSVILYDQAKDEFVFCWSTDIPERKEKFDEIRFPANQGIAGSIFQSGQGELILDVEKDPRHFKKFDSATKFKTKSMVVVPLKTKEKTIGVLEALNKKSGVFDESDLDFLMTLAPIIAMALDNARMYHELNTAFSELQLINRGKDDLIALAKNEMALLQREVERQYRFERIIGSSERMIEVFKLCDKVIDSDITVLIEGETGTGKELVARTIHYNGTRKNKMFQTQNCAGIPDTLLSSELFGHKKGAYTGAYSDKKGLFEIAHGGTVFLDEVAEMSAAMQTNLLRVLQEGEIKPLGSNRAKQVDIRVISATNKNLEEEVRAGRMREDLYYRLSVFAIRLPPLRERVADIPVLANHFIRKLNKKNKKAIKGLTPEAMQYLSAYPFPGNVRELENELERATAMAEARKPIEAAHLSEKIRARSIADCLGAEFQGSLKAMVETLEKSVLTQALEKHEGNKTQAAKELGLSRFGLMKKVQRYGL
jgi:Nif-specific regulatory protein